MPYNISYNMTSIFNPSLYKGKLILISGGATGICYGIAQRFLEHGASVYIISRKIDNINKAIKSLQAETGNPNVFGSSCDVRDEKQIQSTVQKVVKEHGQIDVLINGAAGNFLCAFDQLSPNAFKTVMMIDTIGTFLLSRFTTQYAMKNGGVIINITANLHYSGTLLQTHAGTAKAGVDALTKHMAVELGPRNIRVIGICPGAIEKTEGMERLSFSDDSLKMETLIPMQRLGRKTDIADACLFVASEGATYITGDTILVDGGMTLTASNMTFMSPQIQKNYQYMGKSKL